MQDTVEDSGRARASRAVRRGPCGGAKAHGAAILAFAEAWAESPEQVDRDLGLQILLVSIEHGASAPRAGDASGGKTMPTATVAGADSQQARGFFLRGCSALSA